MPSLTAPTVEQHPTGFGIGVPAPRLSWRFVLGEDGDKSDKEWMQTAYDVEIQTPGKEDAVESYHVASSASVLVQWPGAPLQSRERANVRVRAYGGSAATATEWSPWTAVECGLLHKSDWTAVPITSATTVHSPDVPAALRPLRFRKTFTTTAAASPRGRARLYITGLGVYRAFLNGQRIGDHEMAPGWTSYKHRLNYEVFDIGPLLTTGENEENVLAVEVAEGWYAGRLGFHGGIRCIYGPDIGVMAQVEVGDDDTDHVTVATDASWTCSPSAIVRAEIYDGEVYDAREETAWDWTGPKGAEGGRAWEAARELPLPAADIVSPSAPPVRVTQEVRPVSVSTTPSGKFLLDFGQNLVGRLRLRIGAGNALADKPSGHRVVFTHAEVREKDGELGTRPLRDAACQDTLIVGAALHSQEYWSPKYTFHGFRYVQIDGWLTGGDAYANIGRGNIVAEVLHTDMARTGTFACSHPVVNKLHENTVWSMRGNFLSVPTDCPQRDERLGWTGDIQVFCNSASYLYNTAGMLGDWLQDLSAEHLLDTDDGIPPVVVPDILQTLWPHAPLAVWDDVTVLTPWDLYRSYGDIGFLARQYDSMVAWVDRGIPRSDADGLWVAQLPQLGDWLDPAAPPDKPEDARTSGVFVADAYLVRVTTVLAQVSTILGKREDAARYAADTVRLRRAFQHKYMTPAGLLVGDSQTGLALALIFDLFSTPKQRVTAAARLVDLVRAARFRVATGFAGTPIITHALTQAGYPQVAYRMLLETSKPSWMYPITMGATTIWERWDSMLPDGSINPGEMTSFNHYSLGSVVNWLHESVAGVRPLQAGWKTFAVSPIPGGTITSAEAGYETVYGRLECKWTIGGAGGDEFVLNLLVPANTRALVILPHERTGGTPEKGTETGSDRETGRWIGSGRHQFDSRWNNLTGWPPKPIKGLFDPEEDEDDADTIATSLNGRRTAPME